MNVRPQLSKVFEKFDFEKFILYFPQDGLGPTFFYSYLYLIVFYKWTSFHGNISESDLNKKTYIKKLMFLKKWALWANAKKPQRYFNHRKYKGHPKFWLLTNYRLITVGAVMKLCAMIDLDAP
jgi:hypothetical protein